jgi:hypothetical protein
LSSFFRNWLYAFSVRSLGADTNTLTLSIREAVSTFALPNETVSNVGRSYASRFQDVAVAWSAEHECGLTDTLNAVNTPSCNDPSIIELRQLMASIDTAVAFAYGWNDLDIAYDFRVFSGGSVNDPWRWALSEDVIAELMRRLTALNRRRFEELSLAEATAPGPSKRGRRSKAASPVSLNDLFAGEKA